VSPAAIIVPPPTADLTSTSTPQPPPLQTAPVQGVSLPAVGDGGPPARTSGPTSAPGPASTSNARSRPVAFNTPTNERLFGASDSVVLASVLGVLGLALAVMVAGAGRRARRTH
jgi:hypothetical protein